MKMVGGARGGHSDDGAAGGDDGEGRAESDTVDDLRTSSLIGHRRRCEGAAGNFLLAVLFNLVFSINI